MSHNREEAIIQSQCVLIMWNEFPQTRGCFFSIENEGARISTKELMKEVLNIKANIGNKQLVLMICDRLLKMANSGNAVAGAQAKAMGVVSGVSDCEFLWNNTSYFFEFKTPTGRQSEKQIWWQNVVESMGYNYFLTRSVEQFREIITKILIK